MKFNHIISFAALALAACSRPGATQQSADPHSRAQPGNVLVTHLELNLNADFEKRQLSGTATWDLENKGQAKELVLDTKDLNITRVSSEDSTHTLPYSFGNPDSIMGKALRIQLKPNTQKVKIWYTTSDRAAALQWLDPAQTAGKKHPFLYTQSEAILARTWIPCQDSPGIRFTYNATVKVPKELLALMSAENPRAKNSSGIYTFKQTHAIPSYLMALAIGDISFKTVDARSGVYAEPATLAKASWEFAQMGQMVSTAEKLYGKYSWGRFDVLVLPPSFPFGGMENPMLTFATPTVIAGDRSLVSLIAHELAHSWSGNLVTNATWNDFWLNEGFTTYFERRIVEAVYGREEAKMQEALGYGYLKEIVAELGDKSKDTRLKGDFTGRDPDEGMTDIAYEKGYFFLKKIESVVGRKNFDTFLKDYFQAHAFQSITTEQFLKDLESRLLSKDNSWSEQININAWVYQPGIPANITPVDSKAFDIIDSTLASWGPDINPAGLRSKIRSANEKIYFIKMLPDSISGADMARVDHEFSFTKSGNAEVQFAWYMLALKRGYKQAYPGIEQFLTEVGRRKFVEPLFKQMISTEDGRAWASRIYSKSRANYHSVTYNSIDNLLKR